jgi:hypothetical protein
MSIMNTNQMNKLHEKIDILENKIEYLLAIVDKNLKISDVILDKITFQETKIDIIEKIIINNQYLNQNQDEEDESLLLRQTNYDEYDDYHYTEDIRPETDDFHILNLIDKNGQIVNVVKGFSSNQIRTDYIYSKSGNTFIKGETIISEEIRERLIEMGFYF